jgi:ribonuclease HI
MQVYPFNGISCEVFCEYAANVVEGNWTARTNVDAVNRTAALLVEVRRRDDVHLIHVKGHSADGGNDRADELAWWWNQLNQ